MSENRRSALGKLVMGGIGVIAASLAGLMGLAAAPRDNVVLKRWRRAASTFDLPPDTPMVVVIAERHDDGWYATQKQTVVFVDRDGKDGYRALSAVCTHLGCRVQWDDSAKHFQCPCHGGIYDRAGNVVSGPPPRPLDQIRARVNDQTGDIEVEL
jgi:Rieske Fe-S protein